jgi:hypothetical protein
MKENRFPLGNGHAREALSDWPLPAHLGSALWPGIGKPLADRFSIAMWAKNLGPIAREQFRLKTRPHSQYQHDEAQSMHS